MSVSTLALLSILFLAACFAWTRLSDDWPHWDTSARDGRVPESPREALAGGALVSLEGRRAARGGAAGASVVVLADRRAGGRRGSRA